MNILKKKKLSVKKVILTLVAVLIALLVLISLFAGNYLVNYSIGRSGDGGNRTVALEIPETADDTERTIAEGKIAQQEANEAFLAENPGQTVEITTEDNIHCNGVYYPNGESHDWVIALHGYRGDHLGATSLAQHYYAHNYQVLTPDQVVAFIEDCGYTSVWDIFSSELKLRFGMPEFPLMYTANLFAIAKAGYSFKEASALNQVKNCKKPMLFIHGTADDFIPYEMMDILYQAKPGNNKEKITAPGAGHGEAMYLLGEEYWDDVFTFLE